MTWDKVTDRNILTLHPLIRSSAEDFVNECQREGMYVRIYQGYRPSNMQNIIYGEGRTKKELKEAGIDESYSRPNIPIKTKAKGGESYHNYNLAFDCVEIKRNMALWNNDNWNNIGRIGAENGFEWGGGWNFKDKPHFQKTFGYNCKQLLAMAKNQNWDYIKFPQKK